jgi:hypothetical protein
MLNVLTPSLYIRGLVLLLGMFVLSGCSLLPGRGPSSMDIALMEEPSCDSMSNYVVVPINSDVVEQLGSPDLPSLGTIFEDTFSENKGIRKRPVMGYFQLLTRSRFELMLQ